jgi:hypothetical protein
VDKLCGGGQALYRWRADTAGELDVAGERFGSGQAWTPYPAEVVLGIAFLKSWSAMNVSCYLSTSFTLRYNLVSFGLSYCSSPYFRSFVHQTFTLLSMTARRLSKSFQAKRLSRITQASSFSTSTPYWSILTSRLWSGLQLVAVETILWNRNAVHACWLACYGLCCITLGIS